MGLLSLLLVLLIAFHSVKWIVRRRRWWKLLAEVYSGELVYFESVDFKPRTFSVPANETTSGSPALSVILSADLVPVEFIQDALAILHGRSSRKSAFRWELIVFANRVKDCQSLHKFAIRLNTPFLRIVHTPYPLGLGECWSVGALVSRGTYVFFHADPEIEFKVLMELEDKVARFEKDSLLCVIGDRFTPLDYTHSRGGEKRPTPLTKEHLSLRKKSGFMKLLFFEYWHARLCWRVDVESRIRVLTQSLVQRLIWGRNRSSLYWQNLDALFMLDQFFAIKNLGAHIVPTLVREIYVQGPSTFQDAYPPSSSREIADFSYWRFYAPSFSRFIIGNLMMIFPKFIIDWMYLSQPYEQDSEESNSKVTYYH